MKKDRFVRIDASGKGVDWELVERARQIAGLKGYADAAIMPRSVGSFLVTVGCGAGRHNHGRVAARESGSYC